MKNTYLIAAKIVKKLLRAIVSVILAKKLFKDFLIKKDLLRKSLLLK